MKAQLDDPWHGNDHEQEDPGDGDRAAQAGEGCSKCRAKIGPLAGKGRLARRAERPAPRQPGDQRQNARRIERQRQAGGTRRGGTCGDSRASAAAISARVKAPMVPW